MQVALPLLRATVSPLAQLGVARCPGPFVGTESLNAKVTVPDGVPVAGATAPTLAVNVSAWPTTPGLADDETVVVLAPFPTVRPVEPLDPLKLASPP